MHDNPTISPLVEALFAGEDLAKHGGLVTVRVPGSDVKINQIDLAVKMLAFAFLAMQADGSLGIDLVEKKVLFVKTRSLQLHRTGTPPARALQGLYANIAEGKSVHDAIYAWFGEDSDNPYAAVIAQATQEAIDAGYVAVSAQASGKRLLDALKGATATEPIDGRLAEIEAIRSACAKRWQGFNAQNPALVELVVKECAGGLGARRMMRNAANDD